MNKSKLKVKRKSPHRKKKMRRLKRRKITMTKKDPAVREKSPNPMEEKSGRNSFLIRTTTQSLKDF